MYRSGHNEPDSKSGCHFFVAREFESLRLRLNTKKLPKWGAKLKDLTKHQICEWAPSCRGKHNDHTGTFNCSCVVIFILIINYLYEFWWKCASNFICRKLQYNLQIASASFLQLQEPVKYANHLMRQKSYYFLWHSILQYFGSIQNLKSILQTLEGICW